MSASDEFLVGPCLLSIVTSELPLDLFEVRTRMMMVVVVVKIVVVTVVNGWCWCSSLRADILCVEDESGLMVN